MTRLPWVRLDTDLMSNPKMLWLIAEGHHKAGLVYVLGLCYAGRYATDGRIQTHVLPAIHAGPREAALLARADLWLTHPDGGWVIKNWAEYQPHDGYAGWAADDAQLRSRQMNCRRWHKGPPCNRETCDGIWE